ncbi:MAG: DUF563 domain-containing protein [Rickettsiales bacterium]|nr:DUF563 domain-containing protein [Rickettsiales bacterium]
MSDLFSTIDYQYKKPLNFDEKNSEFRIFSNVEIESCKKAEINILKNVRISTNSVVFNYFKIFEESCVNEINYKKYSKGFKFFFKFIFPKFNFSKKRFLLITDEWTSNYYHWHIFALAKLLAFKKSNLLDDSLLFLPKKYAKYPFVLPSLEKFGVKKEQIVFLCRKSNIKVRELAMASTNQQHPAIFNKLREVLTKNIRKSEFDFGDKIYISRASCGLRYVENENEVVALLEKYGFKKILADNFSYDDQIAICSKARYLVGPHGAGLTNLLFMSRGSFVLEMATKPYSYKPLTDYYKLSSMLDINYLYQECECGKTGHHIKDFHHANLFVDIEKLEKNLQLMLKNNG